VTATVRQKGCNPPYPFPDRVRDRFAKRGIGKMERYVILLAIFRERGDFTPSL